MDELNESSLSRLYRHNIDHDCGAMSAFRKGPDCGTGSVLYTRTENRQRNKSLLAKLLSRGYGVISISGVYPEGGTPKKEESFFIIDRKNTGTLESELVALGEEFEQDSVLFIPKGSIIGDAKAYLIGTNYCENNWLGWHQKEFFNVGKLGKESPIYTSYVNGRPFFLESVETEHSTPASGLGWFSLHLSAKKNWRDLEV